MLASRKSGRLSWLLGCLTIFLYAGCESSAPPTSITGKIVSNGKPVFPVVLMLQDSNGKSYTANVKSQTGEFSIFGIGEGVKYLVAIEPIQLQGISQADRAKAAKAAELAAAEGRELRREDTVPSQYLNANIDFPQKYKGFETSGLFIDCTSGVPTEPIVLDLK